MRDNDIPVKTQAGMQEIGARQHNLHARARSLLMAIHGRQRMVDLRAQFQALGDVDGILGELESLGLITAAPAANAPTLVPATPASSPAAATPPGLTSAQVAKQFMNESAVAVLGLRAFLFTLKLERCYTSEELRALLPEYRRVLGKAKGRPFAEAMSERVEALMRG